MSFGHALFLATGPRCGCGEPAFTEEDETSAPVCARCLLERQRAGADPGDRLAAYLAWIARQPRPSARVRPSPRVAV